MERENRGQRLEDPVGRGFPRSLMRTESRVADCLSLKASRNGPFHLKQCATCSHGKRRASDVAGVSMEAHAMRSDEDSWCKAKAKELGMGR